jgi:methionyl-tRNA synthetase
MTPQQKTFAITTPLYYTNDSPHVGSAYTTMSVDAITKYYRLRGYRTRMITGTDEHGQKIEQTAIARGTSPKEHCDQYVKEFKLLWELMGIDYDRFIRTTDPQHEKVVNEFFLRVWQTGDIYLGQQEGLYCVACEEFKEAKDLLKGNLCPIHSNREVEQRNEPNYFFRLSAYQDKLLKFYEQQPNFIQPESRRNEVLSFVSQGLKDFSISRVNLEWGFPLPTDHSHTLYVWFDALLGYITALLEPDDEASLENAIASFWPINIHVIGKDILRFHAVYWPAMLMSAGLSLPKQVFAHGFLTKDGQKMGKSLGNIIDPYKLIKQYGSDALRYYFLKVIEFGQDGDFKEQQFIDILNADLANDMGNLLNRTLTMIHKYCNSCIPDVEVESLNNSLKETGKDLGEKVAYYYEELSFNKVCRECLALVQASNKFIDSQAPWKKFQSGDTQEVEEILYSVLDSVRLVAYLMYPIIPNLTQKIYQQLGYSPDFIDCCSLSSPWQEAKWGTLPINQSIPEVSPVFQKIESKIHSA